jgi:hypothetical protein
MANLTSEQAEKLVKDIDELRKTAEGTLIDQAKLKSRYEEATAGLLANGVFDRNAWTALTPDQQSAAETKLSRLKQDLLGPWPGTEDGPPIEGSFMRKAYASNKAIILLTSFALFGLLLDLSLICHEWETATTGTRGILEFGTPSVSAELAKKGETGVTTTASPSPRQDDSSPRETAVVEQPVVSPSPAPSPDSGDDQTKKTKPGPTEQAVLWMVILLGALGGFLHLASSMANYVGNRQLLRSWVVYYILIPFQGAALAPLVYLLLRVGVLNPANPGEGGPTTQSLNLIGIYAFAALTGLFSKQAIETLADVFATIFKKVSAKDSLDKPKPDAKKES